MKKAAAVAVMAIAFAVFLTGCSVGKELKDFPSSDVFTLEVSCEKEVPVGKKAEIKYTLSNAGENSYDITVHNGFFRVFVDGKPVQTVQQNGTTETQFSRGESDGQTISVVLDRAGTHEIKVTAAFDVRRSPTEKKEYSYQKTVSVNATE